jgi:non-ribosomal peptide synthetase component F
VALEYHNIVNFCHWYIGVAKLTATDRVTAHAAFGFDCHQLEFYPALCSGAAVHVIPGEMRLDIDAMDRYIN